MPECLKPTNCKANSIISKCGNISDKFAYLMQTKEMLRTVLIEKGQDVPKDLPFRDYVEKLAALPSSADVVTSILDYQGVQHKGEVLVDKAFIGLENVDNTSDLNKPLSTATKEALSTKQDIESQDLLTVSKTIVGAINELNTQVTTNTSSIAANTASITALEDGTSEEIDVAGWKSKLGFVTAADQVQPDWTAASGKAQILNKPDVETENSVVVIGATNAIASVAGIVTNTQQVTTGSASLTCNYNVNGNAKLDFVSDAGDMIEILISNEGSSNFSVIKECTCGEDCLTITNVTWEASGNYAMAISYTATKDGDAKLSYMYGNA